MTIASLTVSNVAMTFPSRVSPHPEFCTGSWKHWIGGIEGSGGEGGGMGGGGGDGGGGGGEGGGLGGEGGGGRCGGAVGGEGGGIGGSGTAGGGGGEGGSYGVTCGRLHIVQVVAMLQSGMLELGSAARSAALHSMHLSPKRHSVRARGGWQSSSQRGPSNSRRPTRR